MITSNRAVKISKSNKLCLSHADDRHKEQKINRKANRKNKQFLRSL